MVSTQLTIGARSDRALQRAVAARPLDQTRVVRMIGECIVIV